MQIYNCTICLNPAKIAEKQQEACRIIIEMNQVILLLLIFVSFKYKTNITGNIYDGGHDANKVGKNETEIAVPLKHSSNFWRTLNIPLITCEIELILTWSKYCALADMTVRAARNNNDPPQFLHKLDYNFK